MLCVDESLQALSQIVEAIIMTLVKTGFINGSYESLVKYKAHQQCSDLLRQTSNNKAKKCSILLMVFMGYTQSVA
jgi:hypothetical protein